MKNYKLIHEVIDLLEKFEEQSKPSKSYAKDVNGFKNWLVDMQLGANSGKNLGANSGQILSANSGKNIGANYGEISATQNALQYTPQNPPQYTQQNTPHHTPQNTPPSLLSDDAIEWEGKVAGRSPESVINTLIVHMNRYAKSYSKAAIQGSAFTTQEEFIYLINLKAFGSMTKMELIKKNVHEKSVGIQIINRLIDRGWVTQIPSLRDKRSKLIELTEIGDEHLSAQMNSIRKATTIVTGTLTKEEKMELIRLLTKLDHFHRDIYHKQLEGEQLLEEANRLIRGSI